MSKPTILLVGEHPFGCTGNGNMLSALLCDLDPEEFDISVFVIESRPVDPTLVVGSFPFKFFPAQEGQDAWGANRLNKILSSVQFDIVFMVGIDIWRYYRTMESMSKIRNAKGFKWGWLFPFDTDDVREDWVEWFNLLDFPCVYSQYGYDKLKDQVPRLRYYRPDLNFKDIFYPYKKEDRLKARHELLPNMSDDDVLFGFIGPNQFRKDPQALIEGFTMVHKNFPNTKLYLHTDFDYGVFNLKQFVKDTGVGPGIILRSGRGTVLHPSRMGALFNTFDCLVNCTMQEGLSWTVLEAMLCGVPVIASETTSQTELIESVGIQVPVTDRAWLPMITKSGETLVEAKRCHAGRIAEAMHLFLDKPELRKTMRVHGLHRGQQWLRDTSNPAELFREVLAEKTLRVPKTALKKKAVLFMQHSAAGDVFMTTRCFRGLRERHPGYELHYMTLPQYQGILKGNGYIDKVLDWDESVVGEYAYVYNPHGDRIGPGHWGRNCNSILSDFYWKILMVEPDAFFICQDIPEFFEFSDETGPPPQIAIVHTTGGDPVFRTYKYMAEVCKALKDRGYQTVQVGGANDFPAGADADYRGKLSYTETAFIVDKADIAVTVDSFVSHLCGAFGVPQVCLFGSGNYVVVRPNQVSGPLVCMVPDYIKDCKGLGPCSASVRDCPAPCTGKHDPKDIIDMIDYIELKKTVNQVIAFQDGERKRVA